MKAKIGCFFLFCLLTEVLLAQRILPEKSRQEKKAEKQANRPQKEKKQPDIEWRWDPRRLPATSKGVPDISAWHTGTAGILPSDAAELSLFNPSRIGFAKRTELLFRVAEEPFLPNIGLKHHWLGKKKLFFASEHTLYYTYPALKILQHTGFRDLIPDSLHIGQGFAMRNELILSWLMNPRVFGCPDSPSEKILSLRVGTEFYIGFGDAGVRPFDYVHSFYHTQILDNRLLYYGGLQFDSYFSQRFHYSVNGLFYSVDLRRDYAIEANLRLTCYVSRHIGISAACKGASIRVGASTKLVCLPLLDFTYLIHPGRSTIQHGLYKNRRMKR
ncbi:MAG: hypothetical protein RSB69_10535 [Odoribacter sp.]